MADGLQVPESRLPERLRDETEKEYWGSAESSDYPGHSHIPSGGHAGAKGRRQTWLLVLAVVLTTIVVGAAVGGGIGSQLHKTSSTTPKQEAAHTVTVTQTVTHAAPIATTSSGLLENYDAEPITKIYTVPLDCPGRNKEQYLTSYNSSAPPKQFDITCGRSLYATGRAALSLFASYHLNDCIEACAGYVDANGVACKAITFHTYTFYNNALTPNCWLFTGNFTSQAEADYAASAYLSS
jgi:hypothetical protein